MRADRLVSILMLLQTRGRMSAPQLAEQLEVSVRTIYRDMDALSSAGIPVYSDRGPNGGCHLVEDYQTDLTGLDAEEARALFLVTAPGPLDSLEPGRKLQSALRKLAASLPGYPNGADVEKVFVYLDWTGWQHSFETAGNLDQIYRAIRNRRQLRLRYQHWWMGINVEQNGCPLGLVAKSGEWFLVYRVHQKYMWTRIAEINRLEIQEESFDYPAEFDLAGYWQKVCEEWEANQSVYQVQARTSAWALAELRRRAGVTVTLPGTEPVGDDWALVELGFNSYEAARQHLLGLGRSIEVGSPEILRTGIIDYAQQIIHLYGG